jgi:hypothetical protein
MINPEVVYAFVGVEDVKFAFLDNSDCCKGCGCPALPPDPLGGVGRTMMEWVLTPGFLEQGFRNEQVRRDIRNRIRGWPFFFWKGSSLLLRSVCALQKGNTGCAPTHRGRGNGHAAAA